ncbi:MAG: hypothetical protein U9Q07_04275 [Planctomycetota bacterium]|nr:hypothetical protein [Planctomycetota bacterium]
MSGFPRRANRSAFGPALEDKKPMTDPTQEVDAATYTLGWWQLSGLSRTGPMAVFTCTVAGGVVTVVSQSLAFDANGALADLTFTYEAAGRYSFAFASQYPDQRGTNVDLVLAGGITSPSNQAPYRGAHDGLDNVAVLTDTTQSWTVNALIGKLLFNLTDGSSTTITGNTADTATGILGGGTDNDWDIGDVYVIVDPMTIGYVQLTSTYTGEVIFIDDTDALVDPSAFILVLY